MLFYCQQRFLVKVWQKTVDVFAFKVIEFIYDFIKFFATADNEYKFWQSSGKIPAVKAGQSVEFITGEDYEGFLQQIADGCRPTLTFPGIAGLKGALGDAYSAVFSGEMTNEQAVDSLVADLAELMEDYN